MNENVSSIGYSIQVRVDKSRTSEEKENEGEINYTVEKFKRTPEKRESVYIATIFYSLHLKTWFARLEKQFEKDERAYKEFSDDFGRYLDCIGIVALDTTKKKGEYDHKYVMCKKLGKTRV